MVDKRTNGDLKDFLANQSGATGGGGAPQVHITINSDGTSDVSAPAGLEQFGAELGRFVDARWQQLTAASLKPGGMLYRNQNGRG